MTDEQVLASWGEPKSRRSVETENGVGEAWLYVDALSGTRTELLFRPVTPEDSEEAVLILFDTLYLGP